MQSLSVFDLRFSPSNGESTINIARQKGPFHIYSVFTLPPATMSAISGLGYQHVARITHDHIPTEWPDRNPAPWRKWIFKEPVGSRRINCHVRQFGQPNQRYALLFRDYLRAFPLAAGGYSDMKNATINYHPEDDMDAYYDIKDPVMDIIYAGAEFWARTINWSPAPSDLRNEELPKAT